MDSDHKKFCKQHGLLTKAQFARLDELQELREQQAYEKRLQKAADLAKRNNDYFSKILY